MKAERFFEGQPAPTPVLNRPVTRQTIFDRVVRHYRKQRRRCPAEGQCFYRLGRDMCFAGPLIDNTHYDPDMEGYRVGDLVKVFAMPDWFRDNISFIELLRNRMVVRQMGALTLSGLVGNVTIPKQTAAATA